MTDFRNVLNTVHVDLTPQPWYFTTHDGGITLTVTPAGLREDTGCAQVMIRISALGQFFDVEASIPTRDLPGMIDALTGNRPWSHETLDAICEMTPSGSGGMVLTVSEDNDAPEDRPQIHIPETERLPLASALRRAMDVARGWES
jgi:hypothetical protein